MVYFNLVVDVFLGSAFDSNVAKSKRDFLIKNHLSGISSLVHDVYLGDDSNGPCSVGIELLGQLKGLRGGHVRIGRNDTQNYCSLVLAVPCHHFLCNSLNVFWLVSNRDSCDTWQINKSKVHTVLVKDLKHYRVVDYATVSATELVGELLNFGSDFFKVVVNFVVIEELSIRS